MIGIRQFVTISMGIAALAALSSCSSKEITRFATTDMTWAEFYAAEIGSTASELEANGYDAVTSATMAKTKRYTNHVVSEDGAHISGMKNVAVGMTESVYKKLSDVQKSRYTFYEDSTFTAYKTLDKKGNFGKYNSSVVKAEGVTPGISCGSSATWGNYVISLRGLKIDGIYHGVVVTTTDGAKYGLKTLDNIWFNSSELGLSVKDFTVPNGNKPSYRHTASIEGKTICNVTYIMSGSDAVSVDADLLVKKTCDAKISIANQSAGVDIKIPVEGLPEGYRLSSVRVGAGRQATALEESQYTFSDGNLTLLGKAATGMYRVTFQSDEYTDLGTSFEIN